MRHRRHHSAFTLVELLVVIAIIGILVGLTLPAIQALRESARRMTCNNRLAQLYVALSEYQLSAGHFPAGTISNDAPVQSVPEGYHHNWIDAVLPYLDMQVMYERIDRDVSIYHANNAEIRTTPLANVRCPSASSNVPETASNYAGIHSSIETPIDTDNNGVFFLNRGVTPDEISDGLQYTLFVGEKLGRINDDLGWFSGTRATLRNVDHPIQDTYNMNEPLPVPARTKPELYVGGLASAHPNGANLLMGGGTIRYYSTSGDQRLLKQLAHRSDGGIEVLGTAEDPTKSFNTDSNETDTDKESDQ